MTARDEARAIVERLREAREARGLSYRALARLMAEHHGMGSEHVYRSLQAWEVGATQVPLPKFIAWAQVLGVPVTIGTASGL